MWEKTTFLYRICNSGFKKISKETIKKLDKEFKSIKNSYFANPLSCHTKPIHVQPSTFCCMRLWTLHSKSSEIFMNPCNFLPLELLKACHHFPSLGNSRARLPSSVFCAQKWRKKMCLQWNELERNFNWSYFRWRSIFSPKTSAKCCDVRKISQKISNVEYKGFCFPQSI